MIKKGEFLLKWSSSISEKVSSSGPQFVYQVSSRCRVSDQGGYSVLTNITSSNIVDRASSAVISHLPLELVKVTFSYVLT